MPDTEDYSAARKAFFNDLGMSYQEVCAHVEKAIDPEFADRVCVVVRAEDAQQIAESFRQHVTPILDRIQDIAAFEGMIGLKHAVLTEPNWSDVVAQLSELMAVIEEVTKLDQEIASLLTQEREPEGDYKPRSQQQFLNHKLMEDIRAVFVENLVSTLKCDRRLFYGAGTMHYIERERSRYGDGIPFQTGLKEGDSPCQSYRQRCLAARKYLKRRLPPADVSNLGPTS